MEDVAKNVMFNLHPNYKLIHQKIYVCITNLPVYDQIRNIRQIHLNTMIRIGGVVTRRTGVFPQLQQESGSTIASQADYQDFGRVQLEVYDAASFGWVYWTLKD
uniref:DNA replication licensing factor MCM2-like isoform X1 n=1 Tax=Fragaria vesca subsp. vesca TaxID=101020 RepID=UPI0005C9AF0F|nr:PREDICTED: DNA replication licensing factor MCM2-like isoform X1 [Fragaria vesca subsp. vesca]